MVAAIGVSIYEYYGLYVLAISEMILFINYYLTLRREVPEALVIRECRRKRIPVIEISDATGNSFIAPMSTESKNSTIVVNNDSVFVNPKNGLTQTPDRVNGLPWYRMCGGNWYFPLSNKNAKAFHDVINHVRNNHEDLNFLDDIEVMVLLNTEKNYLESDCLKLLNSHPESDIEAHDLAFQLQTIQEELKILPIKPGFFTYNYAFKLIPTATTAADFRQLKQYLERMAQLSAGEGFKKMLQYAIFILIVLIGAGVFYKFAG